MPIWKLCVLLHLTRSAYYRWLKHRKSQHEQENERIADEIKRIHEAHPDMGYRRIRDELDRVHDIHVNDKRVLRINRILHIQFPPSNSDVMAALGMRHRRSISLRTT